MDALEPPRRHIPIQQHVERPPKTVRYDCDCSNPVPSPQTQHPPMAATKTPKGKATAKGEFFTFLYSASCVHVPHQRRTRTRRRRPRKRLPSMARTHTPRVKCGTQYLSTASRPFACPVTPSTPASPSLMRPVWTSSGRLYRESPTFALLLQSHQDSGKATEHGVGNEED